MEALVKQIFRIIIIFFVGFSTVSCGLQPESNTSEGTLSNEAALASESNSKESPSIELDTETIGESLSIPDKPLSEEGPWLIIDSWQGLFAINPDGSGLTQFVEVMVESQSIDQLVASQRGGYFAYHESSGNENDTAIHIVSFPSGKLITDIPLFIYSDDPDWNALRAVQYEQSMAFSPDGRHLAFMGVIDGPTSDLYLYTLESGKLLQLTDGRTQGYQPVWSPDGKYILHTGADGFGTGAGFETKGIWTAQADKDSVKTLYTPTPDAAEMIVGWVDDETFVVYSWSQPCGPNNLRTYNVESKKSVILWSEPFNDIALDSSSDTIVLTSGDRSCAPEDGVGTYFIPVFGGKPQRVGEDTGPIVVWSSAGEIFFVSGGGHAEWVLGVDTFGQIVDIDRPSGGFYYPVISPRSNYLFWSGHSPHIGSIDNSIPTTEYFDESIQKAAWTPDGQAVIFVTESGLYIAHQPDFKAILISPDIKLQLTNDYMEWLYP
jgi:hypothetical protein